MGSKYTFLLKKYLEMTDEEQGNYFHALSAVGSFQRLNEIIEGMKRGENFDNEFCWALRFQKKDNLPPPVIYRPQSIEVTKTVVKFTTPQTQEDKEEYDNGYTKAMEEWRERKRKENNKKRKTTTELMVICVEAGKKIECKCGLRKWLTIHHLDGNKFNDAPENLEISCWNHHLGELEGKGLTTEEFMEVYKIAKETEMCNVKS